MAIWRMAFRDGSQGPSFWRDCRERDVAAITYDAVADVALSQYPRIEDAPGWADLEAGQKGSLRHFVTDMASGDLIYVREGGRIVGCGVVVGSYRFEPGNPITVEGGQTPYRHHRPVRWCRGFRSVALELGGTPMPTVLPLTPADVEAIERAAEQAG